VTPPKFFVDLLAGLDPLLRVRWGSIIGSWVIDRQAFIPLTEKDFLSKRYARAIRITAAEPTEKNISIRDGVGEELQSARDNRRVIFFCNRLDQEIYEQICAADIRRYGGYSRLADEIEEQERKAEAAKAKRHSETNIDMWKESYDQLSFLQRKRQTELLNGEQDLKKLLHG
jgi:hypothetical protein